MADFCDEVILAITEKLVKFIENNGIDVHHFDFFEFNQLKDTTWSSNKNLWSFFQTFNLSFLTRARKEELSSDS